MEKRLIQNGTFSGERPLYNTHNAVIDSCVFVDGESPLKECSDLEVLNTRFCYKYPFWYSKNIECKNIHIEEMGRSGIWYVNNISITDSIIESPKMFRRCDGITLKNVEIPNGRECFWSCKNIKIYNLKIAGDYFCKDSENIEISNLFLDGNYAFDGAKNVVIRDSVLNTKDSLWNAENVTCINCKIYGEYAAWNAKNISFIDCEIESNQGLCYIEKLFMRNTSLNNTDLCFELCKDVDAEITTHVISIKNPISGRIVVPSVGELILDKEIIDPNKTEIIINGKI